MDESSINKINEILNSPDLMKNVQAILGGLSSSQSDKPDIVIDENNQKSEITDVLQALSSNGLLSSITSFLTKNKAERIALLTALRPFLSDDKKGIVDSILQVLKITNILTAANILS